MYNVSINMGAENLSWGFPILLVVIYIFVLDDNFSIDLRNVSCFFILK